MQAIVDKIFDVFVSKIEVLHSQIILTMLLIEYFHDWKMSWMSCRF